MRGEETLCAGLIRLDLIKLPSVVLNLGSHWKAIQLDEQGRVHFSVTSLSGELIHSAQTQTVLASSVSKDRPAQLAESWIQAGMSEQRRSGLSRALFCVRLLELSCEGTAEDRFSFLLGAFIATDLDALIARGMLGRDTEVSIVGTNDLAAAWRDVLARNSIRALVLTADEVERAFLAGLNGILVESLGTQRIEELKTVNS
jgi:2-dehydro-3-deoxygalactonokinase